MGSRSYRKKKALFFLKIDKDALKKDLSTNSYEQWMKRYIRKLLGRKEAKDDGIFSLIWEKKKPWTISRSFVEVSAVIHRCTPSNWRVEIAREPTDEFEGWLFVRR